MPTYEYRCTQCKHRFELFHSISDDSIKRCPRCKKRATRVPAAGAGLLFKGSGFYITDYRSKGYQERARQEGSGGEKAGGEKPSGEKAGGEKPAGGKPAAKPRAKKEGGGGGAAD